METFFKATSDLSKGHLNQIFTYRHAVFVDILGWNLPGVHDGLEIDQFDRKDTVHIGARDEFGKLCGYARLLPTTRPYLLGNVFPHLMAGGAIPHDEQIWEISRFSAVNLKTGAATSAQFEVSATREVLKACVQCALEIGIKRFITVSPLGIERLLRKLGVTSRRAGPPMRLSGYHLFACWIEIDENTLVSLDLSNYLCVA